MIVRGVGVSVREGATTEHTDSDTRTQRERETHSPHAVCVGVSEVPMAQRAHRRLWKGQRHNAKGAVPKVKGRRSGESVGGRGRDNRHKGWKSSTPPQTVAFGARLVSCHFATTDGASWRHPAWLEVWPERLRRSEGA